MGSFLLIWLYVALSCYLRLAKASTSSKTINNHRREYTNKLSRYNQQSDVDIAITILSFVRRHADFRENVEPHNMKQKSISLLVNELSRQILQEKSLYRIAVSVCNIDSNPKSHSEVHNLSSAIAVFNKPVNNKRVNIPETDRENYRFCLASSLGEFFPRYVAIIQDDMILNGDFIHVLLHRVLTYMDGYNSFYGQLGNSYTAFINLHQSEQSLMLVGKARTSSTHAFFHLSTAIMLSLVVTLALHKFNFELSFQHLWIKLFVFFIILQLFVDILVEWTAAFDPSLYSLFATSHCYTEAVVYPTGFARRLVFFLRDFTADYWNNYTSGVNEFVKMCDLHGYNLYPDITEEILVAK